MGQPINDAEVFDFASRKWSVIQRMPTKRAACKAAIVREGKIIIVGGVTEKQIPLKTVDCYNMAANTWEAFPPLPSGVTGKRDYPYRRV
jgi:N-acetylneuraminic acid mutarotase